MQTLAKPNYKPGGMKIDAHSGHKGFDNYADYIGTGNVCSNVQVSSFIRPYTETECNGFDRPPGALREWDIERFRNSRGGLPRRVEQRLLELTETKSAILYRFSSGSGTKRTIHGWVITEAYTNQFLAAYCTGPTRKSQSVLNWCMPFITGGKPIPAYEIL